ncbi:outer membrane beta-barrel protein [Gemmatimonas groenlandica]|uniref:Outer membrane beta-barrel protein n=1 Tax=Gemmatimonas groenlandica TaxID=2732249 RepID=A0A6M4IRU9_9BACT|nr:outer membrane beta-barrel protein [Gemmatimonas groenlandica]QJR37634.1 outer membrane beta-barrel protein [Gemmatimonas groenlandica]
MRVVLPSSVQALVLLGSLAVPAVAQQRPERVERTHTTGLLLGYGTETNVITSQPGAASSDNEHVVGHGITLGYGFTRRWAAYLNAGWGGFETTAGNRTGAGSIDLGARYHLPTVGRVISPFLQGGLASRALSVDALNSRTGFVDNVLGWRSMAAFGGGANVHVTRSLAISGMSTWGATSDGIANPRVHLGVLLLPSAWRR